MIDTHEVIECHAHLDYNPHRPTSFVPVTHRNTTCVRVAPWDGWPYTHTSHRILA